MEEYTIKDVIIDPEDPRVEVGKKYYYADYPRLVLYYANNDDGRIATLEKVDVDSGIPFIVKPNGTPLYSNWACLIRKKKKVEPRYVPFDLSNEEDRARLRGAWVKAKNDSDKHQNVCGVCPQYVYLSCQTEGCTPEDFLERFVFIDGTPCGKLAWKEEKE